MSSSTFPVPLVNYDFDTLVSELQSRLAAQSAWKDMYRSSTGQMLLELFAAVGTLVLYYVERRAEESYIATAKNYSSVVNLVRLLNYIPRRKVSSTGTLQFTLSSPATSLVVVPQWTLCSNSSGYSFLVLPPGGAIYTGQSSVEIPGIQGTLISISYVSNGATGQEYNIKDTNIENTYVYVSVNSTLWTKQTSFINSTNTSNDYVIRPELDGTITIIFGNGVFGSSPLLGDTITIQYVKSDGVLGNVYSTGLITILNSRIYDQYGTAQTVTVTNTSNFLGGEDAETIDEIRSNAPQVFSTGDRLVIRNDFTALIKDYAGVVDALAWGENEESPPNYDMFNQVKIAVLLNNWVLPSSTFKAALSDYLYLKSLMTVRYSYVDPDILEVIPTLIVRLLPGASLTYVQSLIEIAISNQFILGTTTTLGVSKYQSDLIAAVEAIAGVDSCHITFKIRKELYDDYDLTYNWANTANILPLKTQGVEIYIDDVKIAIDDGVGGYTSIGGTYTVTGLVNYTTGLIGADITPAPPGTSIVYARYQQDQNGDIIIDKNQICRWIKDDYTSIA